MQLFVQRLSSILQSVEVSFKTCFITISI